MKKVLVVDDETEILKVWIGLFKVLELTVEVHTAENAVEALKMVDSVNKYDLIITDYMMPKMNGLQLISLLRDNSKTKDTNIFLFTGYIPELKAQMTNLDKVMIFEKPVNEKMITSIKMALK